MFDRYLPTIYENVEWAGIGKDLKSKLLCILCRRELGTNTSQHTCTSRGTKDDQVLIIRSQQATTKID